MAQTSHRLRLRRRLKRKASLAVRELRKVESHRLNATITLCMALAQMGGDLTISQGTSAQVLANLSRLSYRVSPTVGEDGTPTGEYVIGLVEASAQDAPETALAPLETTISPEVVGG